ncbi:hypothetical protein OS493_005426 [Desmophyllum pertusum]|uniref:Uncharacterized protein n=1 Tax=Desmophyllum pertusum TaxID=174260 RepID=A0A9X0CLT9_9CNID|nr:hypothetical protein OS493_005426 [Desmophyllum pertusum]
MLEVIVAILLYEYSELRTEDGRIVDETDRRSEDLYEIHLEHPLRSLVLHCLENEPDDRPTALDLVNALSEYKENDEFHRSQDSLQCKRSIHRLPSGQYDYEFKVVMIADDGKYGEYNERLQLKGKSILLQIVDTSGQFNTTSSLPQLYRGAHAAAVVFDVGSKHSLVSVRLWVSMVREKCGDEIPIILVANKTDSEHREVNTETAENVREEFKLFYIEVSAKPV